MYMQTKGLQRSVGDRCANKGLSSDLESVAPTVESSVRGLILWGGRVFYVDHLVSAFSVSLSVNSAPETSGLRSALLLTFSFPKKCIIMHFSAKIVPNMHHNACPSLLAPAYTFVNAFK
jgi:hypothetical protein